ncbi:hypothetical protein H206_00777 [Candidatus Electrothrix aarhusensis]|jgi:hypothetical protein|uniref:Uncharacterized protein n=1 Tax=Candidatus Electrothrix aarhusensis TaxID=1859131 RepID=A0A3S3R7R0_9BACT|nr:hypothetical protein H206_00777 [Candidatus Electrothrix aarhusensis]
MVVKKDQLNVKKDQGTISSFEKIIFIALSSLSLLFLFITCWLLLTGDDVIFVHGSNITPRHLCVLVYVQTFFLGQVVSCKHTNNSEMEQMNWLF